MAGYKTRSSRSKMAFGVFCLLFVLWMLVGLYISVFSGSLRYGDPTKSIDSFQYLLNSDVCKPDGAAIEAVVVVHSDPRHPEVRDAIRRSLPQTKLKSLGLRRAFMLADASKAYTEKETTIAQSVIDEESLHHDDIVQGSFHDSYHNLTYKHIMALDWANTFCSQARLIIKMDDDIVFDVYRLLNVLKEIPDTKYLGGHVFKESTAFRENSKWDVSEEYWPRKYYPPYLSGWLYVITPDLSRELVLQSTIVPFFWIDDTFVTGILAEQLSITHTSLVPLFATTGECLEYTVDQKFSASEESTEKVYKPSFTIGPSGKNMQVLERFNELAEYCHKYLCHSRPQYDKCKNRLG